MAMTTSKYVYRYKYPVPANIIVSPFPYHHYYGWEEEETAKWALKQLDLVLHSQTAPEETAAIIIEPVQGEGGYVPAPTSFMKGVQEVCNKHGIMFIADEVQSGFGRTGKFFAFEHSDVTPDIIVMAKGLGSGMPISCVASRKKIMDKWGKFFDFFFFFLEDFVIF